MRKILEDFYYGSIIPNEQKMFPSSELKQLTETAAQCEARLMKELDEEKRVLLTKLVKAQHEMDGITALENFILGYRLGVRMMAECMDEDDGDIQKGGA